MTPIAIRSSTSGSFNMREHILESEDHYASELGEDYGFSQPTLPITSPSPSTRPAETRPICLTLSSENDEIFFPSYDDTHDDEHPSSPGNGIGESLTGGLVESPGRMTPEEGSSPSPGPKEHSLDDTAAKFKPVRHVDYLSHDWSEEDLTASWKHIVSRRGMYTDSARLENASWRIWIKKKSNLKTVNPETVAWLKDDDLTWLYGPLTPASSSSSLDDHYSLNTKRRHKSRPHRCGKPILKQHSLSEIMLRRSITPAQLMKKAEQLKAWKGDRSLEECLSYLEPEPACLCPIASASGSDTPGSAKKVQFQEMVHVAIANNLQDDYHHDRSDSDEDHLFIPKSKRNAVATKWLSSMPAKKKAAIAVTIEKLPPVLLKDLQNAEEDSEYDESPAYDLSASASQDYATAKSSAEESDEDEENCPPSQWALDRKETLDKGKEKMPRLAGLSLHTKMSTRPLLERKNASDGSPHSQQGPQLFHQPTRHSGLRNGHFILDREDWEDDSADDDSSEGLHMSRCSSKSSDDADDSDGHAEFYEEPVSLLGAKHEKNILNEYKSTIHGYPMAVTVIDDTMLIRDTTGREFVPANQWDMANEYDYDDEEAAAWSSVY